jgi:hypothetical protein
MIRGKRYHHGSVLPVRTPPRHGDLLLSMQFKVLNLTRTMTPDHPGNGVPDRDDAPCFSGRGG